MNPDFTKIDFNEHIQKPTFEQWKKKIEQEYNLKYEELIGRTLENIDIKPTIYV